MLKKYTTLLGIGLVILWAVTLGAPEVPSWMTWLVGFGSLCSFGIAAFTPSYTSRNTKMGEAVLLATGLFILWIAGLVKGVAPWLAWWSFIFACAYLLLGVVVGLSTERRPTSEVSSYDSEERDRERERFRRGA